MLPVEVFLDQLQLVEVHHNLFLLDRLQHIGAINYEVQEPFASEAHEVQLDNNDHS